MSKWGFPFSIIVLIGCTRVTFWLGGGKEDHKNYSPPPSLTLPYHSQFIYMGTSMRTWQGGPKHLFICRVGMGHDTTCQIIHMSYTQWTMWVDLVVVRSSPCCCPLIRKGEGTISAKGWGSTCITCWDSMPSPPPRHSYFKILKPTSNKTCQMFPQK